MAQGIIENLISELTKLPGIGRKTAQRLAFFILTLSEESAKDIAKAINDVKEKARFCIRCFNITDTEVCGICRDESRDRTKICIVEEPSNILVVERARTFNGLYHVLGGVISLSREIVPLKISELVKRITQEKITEVIIATNPTTEGDTTALYLKNQIKTLPVKITRLARGLSTGGDIEYADEITLSSALSNRKEIK